MTERVRVEITANFERNLDEIASFLAEHEATATFDALVDELLATVVPNLERFPEMGADFLARRGGSVQGTARVERLRARLGSATTMREYIMTDYVVLYAVRDERRWLIAIRHHKQLSHDLRAHWTR
jgi:plasmid stabilization system protein ParE